MADHASVLSGLRDRLTSQPDTPWLTVLLVDVLVDHQNAINCLSDRIMQLDADSDQLAADLSRYRDRVSEFTYRLSEHLAGER